jgi:hypothetical protein
MPITITRPTQPVDLWTDAAAFARLIAAETDLAAALQEARTDPREGGSTRVAELRALARQIAEDAAVTVLTFTLSGMPAKAWAEIEGAHPPREGNKTDEFYNINTDTFLDAAITHPDTVVAVVWKQSGKSEPFTPATDWPALAEQLTKGQIEGFKVPVLTVNGRSVEAPSFT